MLPPITPPSPMSPPRFSSGPKSDSSSTYAPSESDHGSTTSPKKNSLDSEKRDHVSFPSDSSSSSTAPVHLRTDLIKVMGYDLIAPTTEISTIPCAGVRIASGKLTGLMCWRLIVELLDDDEQGLDGHHRRTSWNWKQKGKGKIREYLKRPSVVANFILDTGCSKSVVSQEMLKALGFHGKYSAGSEIHNLRIQGIQTPCVVARLGEASRLGGQFMTSGNLTFYFDTKLNAPVLYVGDEANERPALDTIPRTVTDNDDGLARNRRKSLKQGVSSLMSALHLLKVGA
ncbi:hypothetical protein GYMLUDRAFT_963025 [Collybiopsis luxurians FD-317 M1]|uniref:Uncharacterized protein n=1 Tax=Collybiopsis luxurians FD-317 M1 TaxID=944289 RepID=A0A0D0C4G8_9AGAR|nr:hypothetical protein GYMLUDRAFT_963025 [Collybiopsis luxurians FD-317 M1]